MVNQSHLQLRSILPRGQTFPSWLGHPSRLGGIYFATYLARTVKHSTIKLHLAAVRNLQILHGDPVVGKLLLTKVLRGILRSQGRTRILGQPVTPRVLLAIRPIFTTLAWGKGLRDDLGGLHSRLFRFSSL